MAGRRIVTPRRALLLTPEDSVVVVLADVRPGDAVSDASGVTVIAGDTVPSGHKLAIVAVARGEVVRKYGQPIGRATKAIGVGEHVHTHNLASTRARPA